MQLYFFYFYSLKLSICMDSIDIPKLYNDSIHCYANSLMQCLKNSNEFYFLQRYRFHSLICQELSFIFREMKNYPKLYYRNISEEKLQNYRKQKNRIEIITDYEKKNNFWFLKKHIEDKRLENYKICLDLSSSYSNLIDIINQKGLNKQQANDPIEFLELLLQKCKHSYFLEDRDFCRKFLCILDGSNVFSFGFTKIDLQYELIQAFENVKITKFPKIAIFVNNNISSKFNKEFYPIFKCLYIQGVKYNLNSFIVNKYGHNGHFFAVLFKNEKFVKVDNDKIQILPDITLFKGVYAFFYEKNWVIY